MVASAPLALRNVYKVTDWPFTEPYGMEVTWDVVIQHFEAQPEITSAVTPSVATAAH